MGGRGQPTCRAPAFLPGRPPPRPWWGSVGVRPRSGTGRNTGPPEPAILGTLCPLRPGGRGGPRPARTGMHLPQSDRPRAAEASSGIEKHLPPTTPVGGLGPGAGRRTGDQPPRLSSFHSAASGCASTVTSSSKGPGEGPPARGWDRPSDPEPRRPLELGPPWGDRMWDTTSPQCQATAPLPLPCRARGRPWVGSHPAEGRMAQALALQFSLKFHLPAVPGPPC